MKYKGVDLLNSIIHNKKTDLPSVNVLFCKAFTKNHCEAMVIMKAVGFRERCPIEFSLSDIHLEAYPSLW